MSVTTDWKSKLLPQLAGLPLVPCGAGDKFKAPMDPATGYPATNWPSMAYSPEEIAGMGSKVLCVGTRLGPAADGIAGVDFVEDLFTPFAQYKPQHSSSLTGIMLP